MDVSLSRLARIPHRLRADAKIVAMARSWPALLEAKVTRHPVPRIELRNGVVLEGPPGLDLNFLFHEIWIDETYSPPGYEITDDDVVIDIGGNIGVFATYAATRARNVSVHSFEPDPDNVKCFSSTVARSGLTNVRLEALAVAGTADPRRLYLSSCPGYHSLVNELHEDVVGTIDVGCTTLDRIISTTSRCDLLKIDCEGGEYEILRTAAPETLARVHQTVLEYHNGPTGTGHTLARMLEDRGFRIDVFRAFDHRVGLLCATNPLYERH